MANLEIVLAQRARLIDTSQIEATRLMLTLAPVPTNNPEAKGCKGHPWNAPNQLWSLWEMLKKYAHLVRKAEEVLASLNMHLYADIEVDGDRLIGETQFNNSDKATWSNMREIADDLELDSVSSQLDRIKQLDNSRRLSDLQRAFLELKNRFCDQLQKRWLLYIPTSKVPYWENAEKFGEEVGRKIPSAAYDILEACSCYAVGRYDATVYHCMGIVQEAVFKVARNLGITIDPDIHDWGYAEIEINKKLNEHRLRAEAKHGDAAAWANWKRTETVYAELTSDLNAVKKAFRHTSAHYRVRYTEPQAEKVLSKVEDFIVHCATLLPEP
jgi:hypothetical protein